MRTKKQKKKELSEEQLEIIDTKDFLTALHRALYAFIPIITSAETFTNPAGR